MAEDGRRYSAAPKQKAPETILLEAWTEGKRVGSGFLGGAPLEWLVEDNNCDGPSPIEGYDMREWRRVMLETSRGWPATAPCMRTPAHAAPPGPQVYYFPLSRLL